MISRVVISIIMQDKAKENRDRTLTRLINIIKKLNDGEALSVKDLAEEFNVSTRTIQRDFNEKLVGVFPIYQDKRKWKMQDDYKIEKAKSVEDTIILDILEKLTEGLGSIYSSKAKKLLSNIKNENYNPIYARLNIEDISSNIGDFALLEKIIEDKVETICNYAFTDYTRKLTLKPLKIVNFEGIWYIVALDARNDKLKKYHLKSLSDIQVESKIFSTSKELEKNLENSVNIWFDDTKEPFEVILWLDKEATKTLKRVPISKSQRVISEYKDGSCDISLIITDAREITSIIKYWIPRIKVVSPESIKKKVMNDIQKYIDTN